MLDFNQIFGDAMGHPHGRLRQVLRGKMFRNESRRSAK